jgi:hypothetical protein
MFLILGLLVCALAVSVRAADDDAEKAPLTAARALKLGLDGVLEQSDQNEAGQDHGAWLYATARRLDTENKLAAKELELVLQLDEWRPTISKCRVESCSLAYVVNGGGTMYTHGAARDCAEVEDFLATLSKELPLAEGKGSAKANAKIDAAIAFLKTLKTYDPGDKEAEARLAEERDRAIEQWQALKYMVEGIPAATAVRIVAFAEDSLGWLKEQ